MHMSMIGNIEAFDFYAGKRDAEYHLHPHQHLLDSQHQSDIVFAVHIFESGDLLFGHNQHMPRHRGVDIQKCQAVVVFVHFMAWDLSLDNLGKNRILHSFSILEKV